MHYKLLLLVFLSYWGSTLFFTLPKNPLNIQAQKTNQVFVDNFFQAWSFFAPPPNFNDKLYVTIVSSEDSTAQTIELLESVTYRKTKNAPFNTKYQVLDYLLSSTIAGVEGDIRNLSSIMNYENKVKPGKFSQEKITDSILNYVEKSYRFSTLKNYARKALNELNIDINKKKFQFKMVKQNHPQFVDRYVKKPEEEISFSSHVLNSL
jgi:hypothetical protein